MTKRRELTNVAASVHDRLLGLSRRQNMQYQEALQYFAMERFLYRLSVSEHAASFVLKGALMLRVWQIPQSRLTRDIDLLGFTRNTTENLASIIRAICFVSTVDDGITFPAETVSASVIRQRSEYVGVRVQFEAQSGTAIVPMQIDIGFADSVVPPAEMIDYPSMLDFPAPRLRAYPRETTIAEKFHAMVDHGFNNTRMKDFYDLWQLSRGASFDGTRLMAALRATFERRGAALPVEQPVAFTVEFATSKRKEMQWKAFVRKNKLTDAASWDVTVVAIREWLTPLLSVANRPAAFPLTWTPGAGWR